MERASLAIACLALVAIMTLIFLDGSLRYIANSPLVFAVDVVNLYLISAAFLLVLSYTLRHGGHISVDVFAHAMSDRVQALVVGIGLLCASPVVAVMAYEMTHLSMESWEMGEVQVGVYAMPLWLSKAIVAFGMVLLFLRVLHLGVFNFLSGVTGNKALAYPILPMPEHAEEEMV
ncbi:MAG: TRAP transporter small permease subunit [Amaricoccus sp.]